MDSDAPPVVKVSSPPDIVGLLPHHIGFQPAESVVVVCLNGPRRRMGLVMRHDLVCEGDEAQLVEVLAAHFRHNGADGAMLVVYTDAEPSCDALPRQAFTDALATALAPAEVVESLLVRAGRWWSYRCTGPCCPPEGTPVPAQLRGAAAAVAAHQVLRGRAVLESRQVLVASVRPARNVTADEARHQASDAAEQDFFLAYLAGDVEQARKRTLHLLRSTAQRWGQGHHELTMADAARIIVGLHDERARDDAATYALDDESGSYLALVRALCQRADDAHAAPICTVLAWVAYTKGDGGLANVAIERALECDPDYRMARIVEEGLAHQIPPETVRATSRAAKALGASAGATGPAAYRRVRPGRPAGRRRRS